MVFYILPCDAAYDYTLPLCDDSGCFNQVPIVFTWDSIANNLIPAVTIVIFSVGLLVRVLWQKRRLHQKVQWRNYRKMTSQLLTISTMYCALYIPLTLVYVAFTFGLPFNTTVDYFTSGWYFTHFAILLIPITFAISLSEFRAKLKFMIRCCRRPERAVAPVVWTANRARSNQKAKGTAANQ